MSTPPLSEIKPATNPGTMILVANEESKFDSEIEKLPLDLFLQIISYLGKDAQKIPQLNRTFYQWIEQSAFWEKLIKAHFPRSFFQEIAHPVNYKELGRHLLLSESIQENIRGGRYKVSHPQQLRWDPPLERGQAASVGEKNYARSERFGIVAEAPRATSFRRPALIFKNAANPSEILLTVEDPHGPDFSGFIKQIEIQDRFLVTRAEEGVIKVWDLETTECVKNFRDPDHKEITTIYLDRSHIYAGTAMGSILMWSFTDENEANPVLLLQGSQEGSTIVSIVKLDHLLIAGSHVGKVHTIDLLTKSAETYAIGTHTSIYSAVSGLALCPITRTLFVGGQSKHSLIVVYKINKNGKLEKLNCFSRSRPIIFLKMDGRKLIAAFSNEREKTGRELAFDFSASKDASLLDLGEEFAKPFSSTAWIRFGTLPTPTQELIYDMMDEVLKQENPAYHSSLQSGKLAFLGQLNEILVTFEHRKQAVVKAYLKIESN